MELSVQAVFEYVHFREADGSGSWRTDKQGKVFECRVEGAKLVVKVGSTGKERRIYESELTKFLETFNETASKVRKDYESENGSYLLAICSEIALGAPRAWLAMTVDESKLVVEGYDDRLGYHYSWDDRVPNSQHVRRGDALILWDQEQLLGVGLVHSLSGPQPHLKAQHRCPDSKCRSTGLFLRKTRTPRYRCGDCKAEFDQPVTNHIPVEKTRASYEGTWVDLYGALSGSDLRALCRSPKSQHSIREVSWGRFMAALPRQWQPRVDGLMNGALRTSESGGGRRLSQTWTRLGQGRFRKQLLERFGSTCAVTGPCPEQALDAAHLYSFAEQGRHHEFGGLLLRKDIHALFDTGHLLIHPERHTVHVSREASSCPTYERLEGRSLSIELAQPATIWIAKHWEKFSGSR